MTIFVRAQSPDNNRFLLAQNLEQAGDFARAHDLYEALYRAEPGNIVYFNALINNNFQLKQYDAVIGLVTQKLSTQPDDLQLCGQLGKAYSLKGEEQKAFTLWDALIDRVTQKSLAARLFAGVCSELRMIDKTIVYLTKAKSFAKKDVGISLDLLTIYLQTMQYQNAAKEAVEILALQPDMVFQIDARVNPYLDRKELVTAYIAELEQADLKSLGAYQTLQKLYVESKQYDRAFETAKKLDSEQHRQGLDLYQFGAQLYSRGAYDPAAAIFRYLQSTYEKTPLAASAELYEVRSLDMAQTVKIRGSKNNWKPILNDEIIPAEWRAEIIGKYQHILSLARQQDIIIEAKIRLATIYFEAGRYDSASLFASEIIKTNNMSRGGPDANFLMVKMLLHQWQPDACKPYLENVVLSPTTPAAMRSAAKIYLGLVAALDGQFDDARKQFREVSASPRDDNANDALEYLLLMNPDISDSVLIRRYATARLRVLGGDFSTADSLIESIVPDKSQVYFKSLSEIAKIELAIAINDYTRAISLGNAINQEKSNIFADKVSLYLGKIYLFGLKQQSEAKKVFETFLAEYPSSIYSSEVRDLLKTIQG
jgi:tetratricopeptide (TPR) repeat protein